MKGDAAGSRPDSMERRGGFLDSREVWVRGNPRPMVVLAAVVCAAVALMALVGQAMGLGWLRTTAIVLGGIVVPAVFSLAIVAGLPRLERIGGRLRVRVAPTHAYDLPLDVVECFFHGAHALGRPVEPCTGEAAEHEEHAPENGRRRGTLVVRIAERARDWQERPTFGPWAGWKRGSVVLDGLWYEPLSMERFGELANRLVEAKRSARMESDPR